MIFRFLTSLKLTLALLLGLALASIFGTLAEVENNRFELYYQAPWYRALLLALALNILACTWKTLRRNLDDRDRYRERIAAEFDRGASAADAPDAVARLLGAKGFRTERVGSGLLASRGRIGRWGSTVVHVSLLVIMAGGILAEFGFVGTKIVPAGQGTTTYFDWDVEQERPLGFELRVDHFELDYYPIEVKVGVYNPQNRELIREYVTREGETIPLPLPDLSAKIVNFEPFDKSLVLEIFRGDQKIGNYRGLPGGSREQVANFLDEFLAIKPIAYREPIIRQTVADVTVLENGSVVEQQRVMVNHPLVYKGVAFYITAHSQDEFGFWYVGFQVSKDPGEGLVWAGSVSLILGLALAFGVRYRVLAVVPAGTGHRPVPLSGFGDMRGKRILADLSAGFPEEKEVAPHAGDRPEERVDAAAD